MTTTMRHISTLHSVAEHLLFAAVAACTLAACPNAPASTTPGPRTARSLIEYFREHRVLAPDADWGAGNMAVVLTAALSPLADHSCGFGEPSDGPTPPRYRVANIDVLEVSIPADYEAFCKRSPDPDTCESIFDNCVALEHIIICDTRFHLRVIAVAQRTYEHIVYEGNGLLSSIAPRGAQLSPSATTTPRFLTGALSGFETQELVDLLEFSVALRHSDTPGTLKFPVKPGSAPLDIARMMLMSFVLGHEFVHLEQRACASTLAIPSVDLFNAYKHFACGLTSPAEIEADMRGAVLVRTLLEGMLKGLDLDAEYRVIENDSSLISKPFAHDGHEFYVDSRLNAAWTLKHIRLVMALSLINLAEVQTMMQTFGDDAPRIAAGEPCSISNAFIGAAGGRCIKTTDDTARDRLFHYYEKAAIGVAPSLRSGEYRSHMLTPIRFLMLSQLFEYSRIPALASKELVSYSAGIRFFGMTKGIFDGMSIPCNRSPEEQASATRSLVDNISKMRLGIEGGGEDE